jgi:hypothetical protein
MTTTEQMLRTSLRARADRAAYEPTSVLEVARRARRLRRRRTAATALAAAAAVAAVGVPTAVVLGSNDSDRAPAPAGPASGTVVDIGSLAELPTGAPPAVDYVLDQSYVPALGAPVELDVDPGSVLDAAPYPGGVLVTTRSPDTGASGIAGHRWFARDGELENSGCGAPELAVSSDGEYAAYSYLGYGCDRWVGPSLAWHATKGDPGMADIVTANGQRVEPVGVTKDRALYNVLDAGEGDPLFVQTTTDLGPPVQVPGLATASAWDPTTGRVAGCPADGACGVVDEQDGSVLLTLDEGEEPLSFSPDGRYLATVTGQGEWSSSVRVRDSRTGEVEVTLADDEAAVQGASSSVAWEGSRHLLVARVDADGEALVRIGLDGSTALATPVAEPTLGGYLFPGA